MGTWGLDHVKPMYEGCGIPMWCIAVDRVHLPAPQDELTRAVRRRGCEERYLSPVEYHIGRLASCSRDSLGMIMDGGQSESTIY